MQNPLIIANWKMKLLPSQSLDLARKLKKASSKYAGAEVVVCPSFTEIAQVGEIIKDTNIKLGAQDCFWEEQGAFTGEVSPKSLLDYGVEYILVGHSERRQNLSETGDMIHKKVRLLFTLDITPVLCIGETFEERQDGLKDVVLTRQLHNALNGLWLNKGDKLVIAYEPVWVIGSGQDVDPEEIGHTHQIINQVLYDIFENSVVKDQIKVIYGGSVDPENVGAYISKASVQGALVGTASLDATQFSAIVAQAKKL
ncbi:MAG: triose-phosphate isomerase [Parcubacteria group bacterium CG_4_9_14_0_2_um_filter_41_8]|nr:MAG: triose-phosphate isomerase [Parcubacteria group bacterium CG_4_9_14_0_2_um_filter_41_8]